MVTAAFDAVDQYMDYLVSLGEGSLSGMKVALDCANGCASVTAPQIFRRLGAECHVLHAEPNGLNVNRDCGSTHMEKLKEYVKTHGCDVGFAFDFKVVGGYHDLDSNTVLIVELWNGELMQMTLRPVDDHYQMLSNVCINKEEFPQLYPTN